ncbi:MAG: thioredoxin fold domain-containing protein [Rhodospirillales bacterium]|nr:thioredoxin fold domain-containing protein [Rhodospirillales bacterium]
MILFAAAFLIPGEVYAGAGSVQLPKAKVGEDGLHKQDWFADSFLDLKEDVAEAKAANKRLVFIWEQKGCPYCERTHDINFRIPKIVDYIKANFTVIQLNMWGSREVTDFDGKISTEKELAQKWAIRFTPTVQFFPGDLKEIGNKNGQEAELLRVPGYFKPFHFYMLFQYVSTEAYKAEPNFQRYLIAEGTKLRDKGVDMDKQLWADELLFD